MEALESQVRKVVTVSYGHKRSFICAVSNVRELYSNELEVPF